MRTAGFIIAALLAGLVVGSWTLKADLRRARKEVADLKVELRNQQAKSSRMEGIAAMLNIPGREKGAAASGHKAAVRSAPAVTGEPAATNSAAPAAVSETPFRDRRRERWAEGEPSRSMRERLEVAADLWRTRGTMARQAFLENLDATPDQSDRFDVIMGAMNLRLSNSIRTWVDYIKDSEEMTPEAGVRMMNDLTSALVVTYDELDRTMPEDWRSKSGTNFEAMAFINPAVATPLIEIEDKLENRRRPRMGIIGGERNPASRGPGQ